MFTIERSGDRTVLTIWQNLDLGSEDAFSRVLRAVAADAPRQVVVSLAHCMYCDSTGVNVLLRTAARLGPRLTVVVPADSLSRRVFEACRIAQLMPVVASLREALGATPSAPNARRELYAVC